jgi:hypothetical protein
MAHFNKRHALGAIAVITACTLISGCYTQLQTDVVKVDTVREPVRERPQTHVGTDDLSVTTEYPWYEKPLLLDDEVTINARFENNAHYPVLLGGCPHPPSSVIEEWNGSTWEDGLTIGIICQAIYSRQVLEFEPGDWLDFEFHLKHPGWYRIRLRVGPDAKRPTAVVHSNQFLIK